MRKWIFCLLLGLTIEPMTAQEPPVHPWQGKRVAYFGDSITDPRNKGSQKKYWSYLQEWLGITPYVYGVSGRQWNDIPRQARQLQAEHGDDFDAILIFIGTNDYNAGIPLGEWYTETVERVEAGIHAPKHLEQRRHRRPVMDASTYRGRINIALDTLKRLFPTKQIVLLTPIHRAGFYANEQNWQPTEAYANGGGEFLDAYVESVREAGRIWAMPVIDLGTLCGIHPLIEEQQRYFDHPERDCLHPNNEGHRRMAATLRWQLAALPCCFEE